MRPAEEIREKALKPATRGAFFRYWANFAKESLVARCANMIADLESLDRAFGPTLYLDIEEF